MMTISLFIRRFVLIALAILALQAGGAVAQTTGDAPAAPSTSSGTGKTLMDSLSGTSIAEAMQSAIRAMQAARAGMTNAALDMSETILPETNKLAYALGVITIVLTGFRFSGTSSAVAAWTDLLETFAMLGIFTALYIGYRDFIPGIYNWFTALAQSINSGQLSIAGTLANSASGFWDAWTRALGAAAWYEMFGVALSALPLIIAFVLTLIASVIYAFFIMLGDIQVAIGIVLGPLALALGMSEYTRRYFTAWLDYMIGGSLYIVVAAIMGKLVNTTLDSSLAKLNMTGHDTMAAGVQAAILAFVLCLVSLEIPKIAGALFANGSAISGGGAMKAAMKALKFV
ncbi:MAG TPA: type IV secretion system protein [Dongiaceae bacterium]|nr:type IV secretion system protein [Dongiaceae bacterium]